MTCSGATLWPPLAIEIPAPSHSLTELPVTETFLPSETARHGVWELPRSPRMTLPETSPSVACVLQTTPGFVVASIREFVTTPRLATVEASDFTATEMPATPWDRDSPGLPALRTQRWSTTKPTALLIWSKPASS